MRKYLTIMAFLASAGAASADQFIATFLNPNHPRNLNITITQMDASGGVLDTDRRRLARVGANQSTWAVILERNAARVCVTLRGGAQATGGTVSLNNGRSQPLRVGQEITSNGQQICPAADPGDIGIAIINWQ